MKYAIEVIGKLNAEVEKLKAENARLKAEVEQSKRINTELLVLSERQASDIRRLSAELSNITGWGRGLESDLCRARAELMLEKAEVERLNTIIVSGGAVVPDATPYQETDER